MGKVRLDLDSGDDEAGPSGGGFKVNENYAEKYDNWRRMEEMQKMKDKYGENFEDEEESSSESEPEWTADDEKDFLRTLGALKGGIPTIYDKDTKFFKEKTGASTVKPVNKENKKEKPMYLKDYERKMILEKGGKTEEDFEDGEEDRPKPAGYYEEQEKIKRDLQKALQGGDSDSEDDILVKREKTVEETKHEEDAYYEWLKGQKEGDGDLEADSELKTLKQVWSDSKLEESDQFLRDFLLNKDYEPGENDVIPTYDEICAIEEEDKEFDRQNDYEHKYNFRFEEPDQDFIKQYPRTVSESIRKPNEKRKEKRDAIKERKAREKEEKKKEISEMKKMKKTEIVKKLEKLKKLAGGDIPLSIEDLDGDFDPKEYDRRMQEVFNNEYYSKEEKCDEDGKPIFSDLSDLSGIESDGSDYDEEIELGTIRAQKKGGAVRKTEAEEGEDNDGESEEEEETQGDEEGEQKGREKEASRRRKKRNSKFAEAVSREKPVWDPKEKTFEDYFNEYYALDYEDILGDQTTRFKYRQVVPNSFGLSVDEILTADDRQLNAWASVKKATGYRTDAEEKFDVMAYERKGRDEEKKQRIFNKDFGGKRSLKLQGENFAESVATEEGVVNEENTVEGESKNKKKNKKKKNKKGGAQKKAHNEEQFEEEQHAVPVESSNNKKEKKKNDTTATNGVKTTVNVPSVEEKKKPRSRKRKAAATSAIDIEDDRLKAYGINPKKFKKSLKFGKQKEKKTPKMGAEKSE